ncbi:transaldolase family protein [Oceanobacillus sp. Castelsardo]|uniref:transaldolase family protein n=1 Tax=Oceanobacillus sp. Castelsardo TaxID=1851204 RepID=UPI000837C10C|nr:transaldolase family protein [Oceanobacillus sp. Castelsardo]
MKVYIETVNVKKIEQLNGYYPIAGVTTNPRILVNEGKPYLEVLREICTIIGDKKEIFVQAIGDKAEEMVDEGKYLLEAVSGNGILVVPATSEGMKAIKQLTDEEIPTLATTIYTPFQAIMAANAGAKYVSLNVNRLDNLTGNGEQAIEEIVQMFRHDECPCQIIGEGFRDEREIYDSVLTGVRALSVSPDIIETLFAYTDTGAEADKWKQRWKATFGENCTNLINTNIKVETY